MDVKWTPEQRAAIDLESGKGNILVSAAAGSGKTAVLVERIFDKISKYSYDIDTFLVVTFTKAAASGMKEKIEQRFRTALSQATDNTEQSFWNKQLRLLSMAEITTIDAFCLNILKNNFQNIGIDPNFFIMDDVEYKLLRERTIEDLFDSLYERKDHGFLSLVEKYAGFRSDGRLINLIFYIHDFISCFAEPIKWLEEKSAMYMEDMSKSPWTELCIKEYIRPLAEKFQSEAEALLDGLLFTATGLNERFIASEHLAEDTRNIYSQITDSLEKIYNAMDELIYIEGPDELCQWNTKYDCGNELLAANMPARITPKLREIDEFEVFMKDTKELKKKITEALSVMAFKTPEDISDGKKSLILKETASELARITRLFDEELMRIKHKRNSYTFLDIEHMTYSLFRDNEDIRRDYTERYNEILIDEYQDTNGLQDAIFAQISKDNIFMVGDLKQSIYRFRGGDPYIFKAKAKEYSKAEQSGTRVDLSKNFRSRSEVLDSVNDIFDAVMSDTVGDVEYSGNERLDCGMNNSSEDFYRSELHIIETLKTDENEDSSEYIEAEYIAKKIKELRGQEFYDTKADIRRPLKYSDFTILLRGLKNSVKIYSDVFEKHGIPLFAEVNDYFENSEIKAMTALISVIDNAHQDVPLVTAMRSAIFNFTDSELAYIKINYGRGKKYFYESVAECAKSDAHLSNRCKTVINSIKRWRNYIKKKSVAELIRAIYEETGFYDCASSAGGETAQSNLNLLYERAKQYEKSGFKGLFSFTKYIENLKERNNEMAGARAIRHDAVGLMTIHKSKGLEFPVVFLGGLGKRSLPKGMDGDSRVVLHKDFGMGLMFPDEENEFYGITPYKILIDLQNKREDISEKMRLLYVALTRPQYKLIAVGTFNFANEESLMTQKEKWNSVINNGKMDSSLVMSSSRYGDWLIPPAMKSSKWEVIEIRTAYDGEEIADTSTENEVIIDDPGALNDVVYRLLDYKYPYAESTVIPSRTTATEMKELRREKEKKAYIGSVSKPMFLSDRRDAAKRGTAYHNSVAYINLEALRQNLSTETIVSELKRLGDEGHIDIKYVDEKMVNSILELFQSACGQRLLKAKEVYREKNFQTLMDSSEYNSSVKNSEKMILQGVIDCFFIEDDGQAVLVDYKTDKIKNGDTSEVVENYTLQLELYSKAIEQVAEVRVKERYLYLFDINKAVKI